MKAIKKSEWVIHLTLVLVVLFLVNYPEFDLTFGVFNSGDGSLLWPSVLGTILNLVLFYSITFYLIPIALKKGGGHFLGLLFGVFVGISLLEVIIDSALYNASGLPLSSTIWFELVIMVLITHVLVVILAFAYRFSKDWFANERLRRSISEHQLRSELDVLKSQINPHFLFNALNNLFSMALQSGDEKTAEGISKLSEMMRYVFDKTGMDKVAVIEEVGYIKDYIYLQQLRFKKQVEVHFQYPETQTNFPIAPMLLIPFVENAFKYGVSSQSNTEISISVSIDEKCFTFEVENQKVQQTETISSSGVGLENVKKRLNLVYPDQHDLIINQDAENFKVQLMISRKDALYSN